MARLTVPERYRGSLKKLVGLTDGDVAQLRDALNETPPTQSYQALATRLASRVELPSELLLELVGLLFSLAVSAYRADIPISETAGDAVEAAAEVDLIKGASSKVLAERLGSLLMTKAISSSSKAAWLATQQEHIFVDCATYSDIRSVFSESGKDDPKPISAVVVHNLEIEYHRGREHNSMFIALDGSDLRKLQAVVERALLKEGQLQKVIERAGLNYIPVE